MTTFPPPDTAQHDPLTAAVADLVRDALARARDEPTAAQLSQALARLDQPVRLALAGRVKAGKSTLLNALIGEELAATDAGECTRLVTWYVGADAPQAVLHLRDGRAQARPYRRNGGPLEVDLGHPPEAVDHLEIRWPSARLRDLTLIDTPGLGSLSADVSARTEQLLPGRRADGEERPPVADAVVYLLRHAHSDDVRFLEAFTDDGLGRGSVVNAIGVLARADEIGSCRLDALEVVARIADRYQRDPRLRRLCPAVIPVAGLLAQTGTSLREEEFRALQRLAAHPQDVTGRLLLTADRLAAEDSRVEVTALERQHLLHRLGLFGVRLGVDLIRRDVTTSAHQFAARLTDVAGLNRLRSLVVTQFGQRARLLKARSALAALSVVVRRGGCSDGDRLSARAEEVLASAHEFAEIRLLDGIRSGLVDVPARLVAGLEELLGGRGNASWARLGQSGPVSTDELRAAAVNLLALWQTVAESPGSDRQLRLAARTAVRSCEGILAELAVP